MTPAGSQLTDEWFDSAKEVEEISSELVLVPFEEAGHPSDLGDRFACGLNFIGRRAAAGLWVSLVRGGSKIGAHARPELFSLTLVMGQLRLDAPEVPLCRTPTVLAVEVLGSAPRGGAYELLVAPRVRTGELLAGQAQRLAVGKVNDATFGHRPSPRRVNIRAKLLRHSTTFLLLSVPATAACLSGVPATTPHAREIKQRGNAARDNEASSLRTTISRKRPTRGGAHRPTGNPHDWMASMGRRAKGDRQKIVSTMPPSAASLVKNEASVLGCYIGDYLGWLVAKQVGSPIDLPLGEVTDHPDPSPAADGRVRYPAMVPRAAANEVVELAQANGTTMGEVVGGLVCEHFDLPFTPRVKKSAQVSGAKRAGVRGAA
jgi:hypothetical protein